MKIKSYYDTILHQMIVSFINQFYIDLKEAYNYL